MTQGHLSPREYAYAKRATRKKEVCRMEIMLMEYILAIDIFIMGFMTFLNCSQFSLKTITTRDDSFDEMSVRRSFI